MMNYLNKNYQSCFECDKNVDRKIITRSIIKYNRTVLKRILTLAKEHADLLVKTNDVCFGDDNCCFGNINNDDNNNINNIRDLMCDRFLEHTDPEMEIWRHLQEEGCVNQDIETEMRRVQHLLPKRVPIFNSKRSGLATMNQQKISITKNDEGKSNSGNWKDDILAPICCYGYDDISIESNEISKLSCKNLVYDRSRLIKIPQYLRIRKLLCRLHRVSNRL